MKTLILIAALTQWDMAPDQPTQQLASVSRWDLSPRVPEPPINEPTATAEAAPTPYSEVVRVLGLLPTPVDGLVEFGCGSDAPYCVVAAQKGWRATGIEIDPARAAAASRRVRGLGLGHLITIIEGDAITTDVQADVGVAYLDPSVLERLRPRLERLRAFASYKHAPPLPVVKNGDTFIYNRPTHQAVQAPSRPYAVWGNQIYYSDYNRNCNCEMCRSIRGQLARPAQTIVVAPEPVKAVKPKTTGANIGQCCCGGDTSKFCFCQQHGKECTCTKSKGSVWHLNGEWSADYKLAPAEPMWIPPKAESKPVQPPQPAVQPQTQLTYYQPVCNGRNCRVRSARR